MTVKKTMVGVLCSLFVTSATLPFITTDAIASDNATPINLRNPDWDRRLEGGDILKATEKWLKKQKKRLQVKEATKLKFTALSASPDRYGQVHVRVKVSIRGIPIDGKELIVHLSAKTRHVYSVQGILELEEAFEGEARINAGEAISALATKGVKSSDLKKDAELVLYVRTGEKPRLAWRVDAVDNSLSGAVDEVHYIDAATGDNFESFSYAFHARSREVYDAGGTTELDQPVQRFENTPPVSDPCVNEMFDNLGLTYDFFSSEFGRDSWDDSGHTLFGFANWDYGNNAQATFRYPSSGQGYITFGQAQSGLNCVTVLDVVTHEFTHGILIDEANLGGTGQSGALHEAFGDAMAAGAESHYKGSTEAYRIGEEVWPGSTSEIRTMINPPIKHLSQYNSGNGSHANAGIANRAFSLASLGGTESGISVGGLGLDTTLNIWYDTIVSHMHSGENFADVRVHTMNSALKEAVTTNQPYGYNTNYMISVANAWAAVGVGNQFQSSASSCMSTSLSNYNEQILDLYIAYYGRAGDFGGVIFWSNQLQSAGGNLNSIMSSFATSSEFEDRFSHLNNTQLVTNLYQQLFNRDPDTGGLNFYVGLLNAGTSALESIALDILNGATGSDLTVLDNRRVVAEDYYVRMGANTALNIGPIALAQLMGGVGISSSSLGDACGAIKLIDEAT